ncbi:cell division protein FtsX [Croceicoccus gelatinilyticus]|uniref:cell division protein FtsX n=1 Tax=Croceicoccus gelatinilyticus TaxID=2835536 RepID=UPI001BCACE82|nr:FtsX-like permease family protein [Croceicoccus gelatinilyticus]MBS7669596.1 cell division protein [Croceicoccus gelatinilyticus]
MILTRRERAWIAVKRGASALRSRWFPEPASAPLLSQKAVAGPVPWVIAIMTALTVVAAAGGLALGSIARTAEADLAGGVTVQIAGPAQAEARKQASAAIDALRKMPGVTDVRRLPDAEREALLRPWLGDAAMEDGEPGEDSLLVLPELIELRLAADAQDSGIESIREALAETAPDATVSADMDWLAPLEDAISALQWLAVALVGLLVTATAASVLLASRSALAANHDTIEIMHLLGAHDRQVAQMFQKAAGLSAAAGGAAGFAVAQATIIALGRRFADLGPGNTAAGLHWYDWIALVLIPVAGVALAAFTARVTVLATLRRMP